MRRISYILAAIGLALVFIAAPANADASPNRPCAGGDQIRLQLIISGVRNAKGAITINLYGDRSGDFLKKGKRISRIRVPARTGEVTACIPAPAPGSYAVSLYHDEDNSKKLSRNFFGLPIEGYGFSRDAALSYRLPELDEAVFTALPGDTQVRITMRY